MAGNAMTIEAQLRPVDAAQPTAAPQPSSILRPPSSTSTWLQLLLPALTSAGLPRHELPLALVSFNVGVELGQLSFIALILALERSFRILEIRWPRWVQALPGYTVGSLGAFWTVQRFAILLGGAR